MSGRPEASSSQARAQAILIVDDNRSFVDLTMRLIDRAYPGCQLGAAGSGSDALATLQAERWDVVLLDYRLPDLDGLEVLAEIRKRGIDVAVIMVTGEGDEKLAAKLFRMGAYDYLVKGGITKLQLQRSIGQVLSRRRLEEQIRSKSSDLVHTSRELDKKARALDIAYDSLRQRKEQLQRLTEGLEEQIQERTTSLRRTTTYLNSILDSSLDHFIIAADRGGKILAFNKGAEAAFGYVGDEAQGLPHFRQLFSELRCDDRYLRALYREILSRESVRRALTGLDKEGATFAAQLTVSRLRGGEKRDLDGFVIVGRNVTHEQELEQQNRAYIQQIEQANSDLRRKNDEIIAANRLKSQFIANVSHELRTPLNAIIGYTDLLNAGVYGPLQDRQQTAIEGAGSRAKDLLVLINDILDMARIESGRIEVHPQRFDLLDVLREVVETARVLVAGKELEVLLVPPTDDQDTVVRSDRQKVQQIVLNLVNNAVKFTPAGFVRILVEPRGGSRLAVRVQDSGIGIAAVDQETIFDEFRQVDGTSTRKFGGSGLGLAISRRLAKRLGGDLEVDSAPGEGSTFSFLLPRQLDG